jgi:hypothetical protein
MSVGVTLLRGLGLPGEHFPSYGQMGIPKDRWEPLVAARLLEAIRLTGASAVVVDHVSPPRIFGSLRNNAEGVRFIWSRRGLWQPGKNRGALQLSDGFDLVVEPGDLAAPVDRGATVAHRRGTTSIGPVVMIDRDEYLPRDEARDHLRIPRTGRSLLISLGDTDPAEVGKFITHTKLVVNRLAPDPIHLFAPLHPLHGDLIPGTDGVTSQPVYPISRYFNAFDGVISTAGYNSFHEIVNSGMPAVFVPHRGASIDDQVRRAEFAALCGRAQWAREIHSDAFRDAVARMLRPGEADVARDITSVLGEMRGAHEFADILSHAATEKSSGIPRLPPPAAKPAGAQNSRPTLIDAMDHDDEGLRRLSISLDPDEVDRTIIVVRDGDPRPLYSRGFVFESVLTEREWSVVGGYSYSDYVGARIAGMMTRYGSARMIAPPQGSRPRLDDQRRSAG